LPHIVLNGNCEIASIYKNIEPVLIQNGKNVLKTVNIYIDQSQTSILFESLIIEKGRKIKFFGLISKREDGLVIRIFPGYEVEKTDGVKRILAEMAKNLLRKCPALRIGKTNLSEFLIEKPNRTNK
jgi:hypothetical protein